MIDFESEETQLATWARIYDVVLSAMITAMAEAKKALPTEDPKEIVIRDGMILDQLHEMLAAVLGMTEGQILRHSMRTDESLVAQRQRRVDEGRVRGAGAIKQ